MSLQQGIVEPEERVADRKKLAHLRHELDQARDPDDLPADPFDEAEESLRRQGVRRALDALYDAAGVLAALFLAGTLAMVLTELLQDKSTCM